MYPLGKSNHASAYQCIGEALLTKASDLLPSHGAVVEGQGLKQVQGRSPGRGRGCVLRSVRAHARRLQDLWGVLQRHVKRWCECHCCGLSFLYVDVRQLS
jgi:hypothetical protein